MVKAADALAGAGYSVRVVSMSTFEWGAKADRDIVERRNNSWKWDAIDYRRDAEPFRYFHAASRQRAAMAIAGAMGARSTPFGVAARASERGYVELRDAAASEPAQFIYGGGRALSASSAAARKLGVKYALDLEDFHSGEVDLDNNAVGNGELIHSLFSRIESTVLGDAAFLTAGSDAITQAYQGSYGVIPTTINNVFEVSAENPSVVDGADDLRLYWVSQMITARRGIEDVIAAIGMADVTASLTLRGRPDSGYVASLRELCARVSPRLKLVIAEPVFPDDLVAQSRNYDVGLAVEQGYSRNNALALSNKAFVYLAAGLAVVFTDTPGQRELARTLGDAAAIYQPGDIEALALKLREWADDRAALKAAKRAARDAARERWHWPHAEESGKLIRLVASAL